MLVAKANHPFLGTDSCLSHARKHQIKLLQPHSGACPLTLASLMGAIGAVFFRARDTLRWPVWWVAVGS